MHPQYEFIIWPYADMSGASKCLTLSYLSCADGRGDWSSDGCQTMGFCDTGEVMCACDHLTSFAVLNVSPLLDSLVLPIQAPPIQALSIQAPSIRALSIQAPPIQALSIQAPPIQAPLIQAAPIQALSIHRHAHISSISHSSLTEVVNKVHYSLPTMQEPNGKLSLQVYTYIIPFILHPSPPVPPHSRWMQKKRHPVPLRTSLFI